MAEKNNATCSICGKGYYKCLSCQSEMKSQPWKQYTDTSEHYKIYQVIHGFNIGVYTKDEANKKLQAIDLSDLNDLRDNIRKIIKDIMKEDKKAVDAVKQVVAVESKSSYVNRKKKYSNSVENVLSEAVLGIE